MGTRFLTVTLVLAISVGSASADVGLHVSAHQAVLLAQDIRFEPALQLAAGVGIGTTLTVGEWVELGSTLTAEKLNPSPVGAGYQYRGLTARQLWAEVTIKRNAVPGVGVRMRAGGSLGSYDSTFLLFFYPEIELGPVLMLPISQGEHPPRVGVEWYLAVGYRFRQDLDLSPSVGLHGRIRLDFRRFAK